MSEFIPRTEIENEHQHFRDSLTRIEEAIKSGDSNIKNSIDELTIRAIEANHRTTKLENKMASVQNDYALAFRELSIHSGQLSAIKTEKEDVKDKLIKSYAKRESFYKKVKWTFVIGALLFLLSKLGFVSTELLDFIKL